MPSNINIKICDLCMLEVERLRSIRKYKLESVQEVCPTCFEMIKTVEQEEKLNIKYHVVRKVREFILKGIILKQKGII